MNFIIEGGTYVAVKAFPHHQHLEDPDARARSKRMFMSLCGGDGGSLLQADRLSSSICHAFQYKVIS